MRYWVTTHWPPREGDEPSVSGVWLPEGRQAAGDGLAPGGMVIVYQCRSGKSILVVEPNGRRSTIPCKIGRQGVIYYGRLLGPLTARLDVETERYVDGSSIWWRWFAPLQVLSRTGFVGRKDLATLLGYAPTYSFHGFGHLHAGLQEITAEQFQAIVARFHDARPLDLPSLPVPRPGPQGLAGGESPEHRRLKERVAGDPSRMLGEAGLRTIRMEYPFPTGDKADIVLADAHDRIVGVEVETIVAVTNHIGPLQAIKYRFMLEWLTNRERGDSRAILVAHRIDADMRSLCAKYGVECKEVEPM